MVLSDVLRCVLHNIVCPCWFWPWYCLTFFDVFSITLFLKERQKISWPKPSRTNNVIQNTSKNVRQYHGQNQQGQTMLYKTHRRTSDNAIAKTNKDKQCYTKHIGWFWPWYCLTFFDVFYITLLFLVGFGHGNVWRSSMCFVLHCLSLLILAMVLWTSDNTIAKTNKDKQCYTKHIEERQPIP
jgi:hypothetical protein